MSVYRSLRYRIPVFVQCEWVTGLSPIRKPLLLNKGESECQLQEILHSFSTKPHVQIAFKIKGPKCNMVCLSEILEKRTSSKHHSAWKIDDENYMWNFMKGYIIQSQIVTLIRWCIIFFQLLTFPKFQSHKGSVWINLSHEEIKEAINTLQNNKAPMPDGFVGPQKQEFLNRKG